MTSETMKTLSRDEYRDILTRLKEQEREIFAIQRNMEDEQRQRKAEQLDFSMKLMVGAFALFNAIIIVLFAIGRLVN